MTYKITIITVCLNIVDTIRRTCDSIVKQTFRDFQWIVVDGASTDGTLDILKEYTSRIDIFISEPDSGIYNAMNKGIKLAEGEYLLFLNGGDKLTNNEVLDNIVGKLSYYPIITCNLNIINHNGKKDFTWHPKSNEDFYNNTLPHNSTFILKQLFEKYGFYDENLKICADREFFVKTIVKHKIKYLTCNIDCSDFYTDGISCSNSETLLLNNREINHRYYWWRLFKEEHPRFADKIEFIRNSIRYPRYFLGYIKQKLFNNKAKYNNTNQMIIQ